MVAGCGRSSAIGDVDHSRFDGESDLVVASDEQEERATEQAVDPAQTVAEFAPAATTPPAPTSPATAATCGDGQASPGEQCDDGNTTHGDGCDSSCQVESVRVAPSSCGDGELGAQEQCDDGNQVDGDGCTSDCRLEAAWPCEPEPCLLSAFCGDSRLHPAETCDDGNTYAGDGCDENCEVETGYECKDSGWHCTAVCNDGLVVGDEECDDGDAETPGCDVECRIEPGYVCEGSGSCRAVVCGDGIIDAIEVCDDGENDVVGDGCSPGCRLEPSCTADGCTTRCGDRILTADSEETCDDGNLLDGDGCDRDCQQENGFECVLTADRTWPDAAFPITSLGYSTCATDCGDGVVVNGEQCDDGVNAGGYGRCDAGCKFGLRCGDGIVQEDAGEECDEERRASYRSERRPCAANCKWGGYCGDAIVQETEELCDDGTFYNGTPATDCGVDCTPSCGNGLLERDLDEECDDGNQVLGDGCSPDCLLERNGAR
jgi:cysteine-rich repeat protein